MLKKVLKEIAFLLNGGYNERKFWDKWADKFILDPQQVKTANQHLWMLRNIKDIKPDSILEIGCGFGRNIKFLIENGIKPDQITGVDISGKMIRNAKNVINNNKVKLRVLNVMDLNMLKPKYDLILLHGILMHIKPEKVESAIENIIAKSKKYILVIEQNYEADQNSKKYTFLHNYENLFTRSDLNIKKHFKNKTSGLDYFLLEVKHHD